MMSVSEANSVSSRGRCGSTWSDQFGASKRLYDVIEDDKLSIRPDETEHDAFIHAGEDVLSPPCFNFKPLDLFLRGANLGDLTGHRPYAQLSKSCLIDDRGSLARQSDTPSYPQVHKLLDPLDIEKYHGSHTSQLGNAVFRQTLDEKKLYYRLLEKRTEIQADRRVMLITDLTPLCAIALAVTVANRFAAELKIFLQAHVLGEIFFHADMVSRLNTQPTSWDSARETIDTEPTFTLGFHLSYLALREGPILADRRGIRQVYSMIKPMGDPSDELYYYDAQISFLITGVDESQWTAYCIIDRFMGSNEDAETYFVQKVDGPSGGARKESQPCWNPREYFLIVLSQRIQQMAKEWGNITSTLMARLDAYESHYIRVIDRGDLRDNADMTQIRSYMKAVCILRQLQNTLFELLDSLQAFLDDKMSYFDTKNNNPEEQWKAHFDRITREIVHLRRWERRLMQRIQRFDGMKDGLMGSSSLLESRRSNKQGHDIGLLTNMTVAYLPFNLAASIFNISTEIPRGIVWLWWFVTSATLGLVTLYFAFWGRVRNWWMQRTTSRDK